MGSKPINQARRRLPSTAKRGSNELPVTKGTDGRYPKCPACWSERLVEREISQALVYKGHTRKTYVQAQCCMECEFQNPLVPKGEWRKLEKKADSKPAASRAS